MQQSQSNNTNMPQTLLGFYFHRAFRGLYRYIILFMVFRFLSGSNLVIWPYVERWAVSMLEGAPMGMAIFSHVFPTIAVIVFLLFSISTSFLIRQHIESIFIPYMDRRIQTILTDHVHKQSMSFWLNRMAGSINANIGYCVNGAKIVITNIWAIFVRLVMLIINSSLLFTVNKYIAITFLCMFILRVVCVLGLRKPIKRSAENCADAGAALAGKVLDGFANNAVVRIFAAASNEHNYLEKPRQEYVDKSRRAMFFQRMSWAVPDLFENVMFGCMLLLCAYLYGRGEMQISDVVYSIAVYNNIMWTIATLVEEIPTIIDGMASAGKGYKNLVVPIEVTDAPNAVDLNVKHGKIELKNVSFKYKNRYVLRDLSLTIKPGERVGIVGASGAGKTTLVNLLMRFYDVKRGAILIDGMDIRDVRQDSLRANISLIPQDPAMFNRTIRENIAYGRPNATDADIRRAAKNASADKFIMMTEKKYNTMVGDRGIKLSGGQRQRIAIARAFLKNAPILILDEATSALDSETEVAIQYSFEKLSHNRTTIAIAHRLSTLRNMDRIVVLDKGRIIESGTHNSLLRQHGAYARLWKMQSGGFLQDKIEK